MIHHINNFMLRKIEFSDSEALYVQKNDNAVTNLLGGFSFGYSIDEIKEWIIFHSKQKDEIIYGIVDKINNKLVGHVGLYKIDFRVRSAEFAIMIGDKDYWGKGLGKSITKHMLSYAFNELNMYRIQLSVLESNEKAIKLYKDMGFVQEGILRKAQFKNSNYIDVILMSMLKEEYEEKFK